MYHNGSGNNEDDQGLKNVVTHSLEVR